MEYLKLQESITNCSICRNLNVRRRTNLSKNYIEDCAIRLKYMSYKDGYEQIYYKSLMAAVKKDEKESNTKPKKHHKKRPTVQYQVYTLHADHNNNKPKKKQSKDVYNYPFSSSSSETSMSFIQKSRKKLTHQPHAKKRFDDEDTDSEFSTCNKFPITEKHYRHIVDGVECSSHQNNNKPSISKKKPKEDKTKITKRADEAFNQINFKGKQSNASNLITSMTPHVNAKKKCHCRSKCKRHSVEEEYDERSDSELSERTFSKFINSLHSYVNKANKHSKKILDSDSSCSLCQHDHRKKSEYDHRKKSEHDHRKKSEHSHREKSEHSHREKSEHSHREKSEHDEAHIKKKKMSKENDVKKHSHHHHHHHHQHCQTRHKTDPKGVLKKYLHE